MTGPQAALAAMIARGARALAGFAASDLLESRPETAASFPADAFERWQDLFAGLFEALASALAVGRPQLLSSQMRWTAAYLAARGVSAETFRASLASLRAGLAGQLPRESQPLGIECLDQALADFDRHRDSARDRLAADTPHGRLAAQYLLAVLEGDSQRACRLVLDAARGGTSPADLCLHVLLPAQEEIGMMWMSGEVNVAEEHLASATTKELIDRLFGPAFDRPLTKGTLVAAAVAGNLHDLGLHVVGHFFQMDGWRVIQLGANVPQRDLVEAVEFFRPDLVALSVALAAQLPALKAAIDALRASDEGAKARILVGGGGLAELGDLASQLGADGYAAGPEEAVALGNALARPQNTMPDAPAPPPHQGA